MVEFHAYLSLFFICLIPTVLIWARFFKYDGAKSRHPPTPFGLPIIGHLHLLRPIAHQALYKLSLRYGPIYRIFMGSVPSFVVCSAHIAKEFLRTNEKAFSNKTQNIASRTLIFGSVELDGSKERYISNDLLFAPYGPHWTFMKKISMSHLLNKTTLDLHASVRHDEMKRFLKTLSQSAKDGKSVNLSVELMKLINNMLMRMIIGKRCMDDEGKAGDFIKLISDVCEVVGTFNPADYIQFCKIIDFKGYGKKFKDVRSRFDTMTEKLIEEHEEARKHNDTVEEKDFIDILLDIQQDESMERKLSRVNIKSLLLNLVVAGTDTSALTVEWTMAELINHPNIMEKAKEEMDRVVGKNRLVQESDIPNLPYLQAIVKEGLRLHPAAPLIQRTSLEDCIVAGYNVPAHTNVVINLWAVNRDAEHWENPLDFRPDRFEDNMLDVRGQHFHFLPFSSGRRMCPGISLGLLVVHTTLASMIQCFDWKAGKDGNLTSVDMEDQKGAALTLLKASHLVCVPVARLDPLPI